MGLLKGKERARVAALSRLASTNPFLPERIEHERDALGERFTATRSVWSVDADLNGLNPNLAKLEHAGSDLVEALRERLAQGEVPDPEERVLYQDLVFYVLYARYSDVWLETWRRDSEGRPRPVAAFERFAADVEHLFGVRGFERDATHEPAFLFAYGYQTRRAFHHVFRQLYGASLPMARLRAAVWQSIFTHDRARYRRALVNRMQDWATLVTGPSGSGKELVSRAIGLSRFLPFDPAARAFSENPSAGFHPVNLSALTPTLIESELFGHAKGAFTGAVEEREGWFESSGPRGTVFLDEIGELDPGIQVKLLRVLQTRRFSRLGETGERRFEGKVIAATNRDLAREIAAGRFREDLYYRLCADQIRTPSLREQLDDRPSDLADLVLVVSRRLFGDDEGDAIAQEVGAWIAEHLGPDYPWHGNIRELEQCVRNLVIRGAYQPAGVAPGSEPSAGPREALGRAVASGSLDVETLLARYATLVYHETGSYEEAARRMGIDRRTVKARIDAAFLVSLGDVDA